MMDAMTDLIVFAINDYGYQIIAILLLLADLFLNRIMISKRWTSSSLRLLKRMSLYIKAILTKLISRLFFNKMMLIIICTIALSSKLSAFSLRYTAPNDSSDCVLAITSPVYEPDFISKYISNTINKSMFAGISYPTSYSVSFEIYTLPLYPKWDLDLVLAPTLSYQDKLRGLVTAGLAYKSFVIFASKSSEWSYGFGVRLHLKKESNDE